MDLKSGDLFLGVVVDLSLRRTSFGCLLAQSSILGAVEGQMAINRVPQSLEIVHPIAVAGLLVIFIMVMVTGTYDVPTL